MDSIKKNQSTFQDQYKSTPQRSIVDQAAHDKLKETMKSKTWKKDVAPMHRTIDQVMIGDMETPQKPAKDEANEENKKDQ